MTQFAVVKMGASFSDELQTHLMPCPRSGLLSEASEETFGRRDGVFVLSPHGRQFDDAYLSAQRDMADGARPDETGLLRILNEVSVEAEGIALWYGDDFHDLPTVSSWSEFHSILIRDLSRPASEIYLAFRSSQPMGPGLPSEIKGPE